MVAKGKRCQNRLICFRHIKLILINNDAGNSRSISQDSVCLYQPDVVETIHTRLENLIR